MKNQKDCDHSTLRFASGDYYIFCSECPARWIISDPWSNELKVPSAAHANIGIGCTLSGQERCKPSGTKSFRPEAQPTKMDNNV